MNISILGLGYVGVVSFGCLTLEGHHVIGVDIDPAKLDLLRSGVSPIVETGMQDLIGRSLQSGRAEVTDDVEYAIHNSEISFICVGTPANSNGSQDLSALTRIAVQVGAALKSKPGHHVIVIRSTVPPGTVEGIIKESIESHSGKRLGEHFGLCFQPEFIREGSSIRDYNHPPFTVVGGDSERSVEMVRRIFGHFDCDFIVTSIRTAEMLKYCSNVFHAVKIVFANEIGRICRSLDIDSREVMELFCRDTHLNISPAYLKPGFAFGGSCLPKDMNALLYLAKTYDATVPMLSQVPVSNRMQIDRAVDMVLATGKRSVGMLGLSFKSGTDDLRDSPLVILAEQLIGKGMNLRIFDSEVSLSRLIGANRRYIEATIPHIGSLIKERCGEVIKDSEVIVVGLPDKAAVEELYAACRRSHIVIDLTGAVDKSRIAGEHHGICW